LSNEHVRSLIATVSKAVVSANSLEATPKSLDALKALLETFGH